MKKIILSICFFAFASMLNAQKVACDPSKEKNYKCLTKQNEKGGYGAIITKDGAITLAQAEADMKAKGETKKENVVIYGIVDEVCQKKGCWMTVDNGNGKKVRIRFKDYAFFVPANISGWTVYAKGTVFFDTTTVEELKHYATDAKKSQAEIDAITVPEIDVNFTAEGVLFEKK
ncbi:MAG: DUF4920 domain-containing protein [Chitinophagales bacterium]|nr:DUF4920 domain-containing protein [Chitinophagales bacterium]